MNTTTKGDYTTPQICTAGSYCQLNTSTTDGVACPPGFYCPPGQAAPIPAPRGYFARGYRSVEPSMCPIGSFSDVEGLDECKVCSPGHFCPTAGLILPEICSPGTYRNVNDSIFCIACSTGSYSPTPGISRKSECLPCPAGYVCPAEGMPSLAKAIICPEGFFCANGTDLISVRDQRCPAGYFCGEGTSPATKFDQLCEPGYVCLEGTMMSTRRERLCPEGYYCPAGTNMSYPHTMCPRGTSSNDAAKSLDDCWRDDMYLESVGGYLTQSNPIALHSVPSDIVESINSTVIVRLKQGAFMSFHFNWTGITISHDEHFRLSLYTSAASTPLYSQSPFELKKLKRDLPSWFRDSSFPKNGSAFSIDLTAKTEMFVRFEAELLHGRFLAFMPSFLNTTSVTFTYPSRAVLGSQVEFLAVVTNLGEESPSISLNYPDKPDLLLNFNGSVGTKIVNDEWKSVQHSFKSFWIEHPFVVTRYLPFISGCRGYDSYPFIAKLSETASDTCLLVPDGSVVPVDQWSPFLVSVGDVCTQTLECSYEENMQGTDNNGRWYEMAIGATMFFITQHPRPYSDFLNAETVFADLIDTDELVPVTLALGGAASSAPRLVTITLGYLQEDPKTKRIISATVELGTLDGDLTESAYSVKFNLQLLQWFDVLNNFGFDVTFYIVVYILIAAGTLIVVFLLWIVHRLFTPMKHPPALNYWLALWTMFPPMAVGFILLIIPYSVVVFAIWFIFNRDNLDLFGSYPAEYDSTGIVSDEQKTTWRYGRTGCALMIAGAWMLLQAGAVLSGNRRLIGKKSDEKDANAQEPEIVEDDEESGFTPFKWKRNSLILMAIANIALCLALVEFSFWPGYADIIYFVLVAMKIFQPFYEKFVFAFLTDAFLVVPYNIVFSLTQFVVTMGAATFMDFVIGYLVDFGISLIMRIYGARLVSFAVEKFGKLQKTISRKIRIIGHKFVKSVKLPEEEVEEEESEASMPLVQVVESLIGYSVDDVGLMSAPFIIGFFYLFRKETQIGKYYGIRDRDFFYYIAFSGVLIVSSSMMDPFLDHILDMLYGLKILEYMLIKTEVYKFRPSVWQAENLEEDPDVLPAFRAMDAMCFSPQYFFLMAYHSSGMILLVFGMEMINRVSFNSLADPWLLPMALLIILLCMLVRFLSIRIATVVHLWELPDVVTENDKVTEMKSHFEAHLEGEEEEDESDGGKERRPSASSSQAAAPEGDGKTLPTGGDGGGVPPLSSRSTGGVPVESYAASTEGSGLPPLPPVASSSVSAEETERESAVSLRSDSGRAPFSLPIPHFEEALKSPEDQRPSGFTDRLQSDSFRGTFLDYNRPWLVDQFRNALRRPALIPSLERAPSLASFLAAAEPTAAELESDPALQTIHFPSGPVGPQRSDDIWESSGRMAEQFAVNQEDEMKGNRGGGAVVSAASSSAMSSATVRLARLWLSRLSSHSRDSSKR